MVTKEQINALISNQVSCLDMTYLSSDAEVYATHLETFAEDLMILVDQEITASYKLIEDLTVELQKSNDAGIEMSKVICKALP